MAQSDRASAPGVCHVERRRFESRSTRDFYQWPLTCGVTNKVWVLLFCCEVLLLAHGDEKGKERKARQLQGKHKIKRFRLEKNVYTLFKLITAIDHMWELIFSWSNIVTDAGWINEKPKWRNWGCHHVHRRLKRKEWIISAECVLCERILC